MVQDKVYFVGAGPGDLDLITVKGLRLLQKADVVIFDRLVNPFLLMETSPEAKLVYCGKQPCKHTLRQEDIQKELLIHAKKGLTVVRLKGGDPSVFGRVGEEAELCAQHQIKYEIIPGITSGSAASMYAGVPVTYRKLSGSFATVTGHTCTKDGKPAVNWSSLAKAVDTIVFYMGMKHLPTISNELIHHGKSKDTPILLVQWGTYSKQRTVEGTLATIAAKAELAQIQNPAIILVGEVVKLRAKLNWFEQRPLSGRGMLIPTATDFCEEVSQLKEQGADVYTYPFLSQAIQMNHRDQLVLTRLFEDEHINTICLLTYQDYLEFFEYIDLSGINMDSLQTCTFICCDYTMRVHLSEAGFNAYQVSAMNVERITEALLSIQVQIAEPLRGSL
ncbi:uroporphyrinogen-III C-methyltransferase [Alkalicoccobacillus gibsonii]|uniref:uroporphyrinogen-III C-methyltransferase n=1 Tax=Alkalicoccobacillus gibsonii TaxID=79881 RepID=UPI003F7C797B